MFLSKKSILAVALVICIPVFAGSLKMNSIDTIFPKASTKAAELYVVDITSLSHVQVVMLQTLQGLAAQESSTTQIYLIDSGCNKGEYNTDWYNELWLKNMDVTKHSDNSFEQVIKIMVNNLGIQNYILYDDADNVDSMNIALSLAGTKFALPVDKTTLKYAKNLDLKKSIDVSSMTYSEFLNKYKNDFSKNFAAELKPTNDSDYKFLGPVDYAIMNKSLIFFGDKQRTEVLSYLNSGAFIIGWGNIEGSEQHFISQVGNSGDFYIAADWARNLTVFSAYLNPQPTNNAKNTLTYNSDDQYVTFIISDGDNLQWNILRGNSDRWWGNSNRGNIPVGWTIAPSLYYLAPKIWNYYIDNASSNDDFIVGPSGLGFFFGGGEGSEGYNTQLKNLNEFMNKSKLSSLTFFGYDDWNNDNIFSDYLSMDNISGMFYFEFYSWAIKPYGETIKWVNNKPVLPATEYLTDGKEYSVENSIKNGSSATNNFHVVYVNAWAKNSMDLVKTVYDNITQINNIKVVTPDHMIDLAKQMHNKSV